MDDAQREKFFNNLPAILAADAEREHVEMVLQPGQAIVDFLGFQKLVHGILTQMGESVHSGQCGFKSDYEKMNREGIDFDDPRGHEYTVSFQKEGEANRFMTAVAKIVERDKTFPFVARPPAGPVGFQNFTLIRRLKAQQ